MNYTQFTFFFFFRLRPDLLITETTYATTIRFDFLLYLLFLSLFLILFLQRFQESKRTRFFEKVRYLSSLLRGKKNQPKITLRFNHTYRVHKCVRNGGKVLIPVFALGRAQELCLLLEVSPYYTYPRLSLHPNTDLSTITTTNNTDLLGSNGFEGAHLFCGRNGRKG